jgi:hypothetical protein
VLLPWHLGQCQGNLTEGRRISTVDLLLLTNLDQLIFILKRIFIFVQKRFLLLGGPLYLVFPLSKASLVMLFVVIQPKEQRKHSRTKKINLAIWDFVKFKNYVFFFFFFEKFSIKYFQDQTEFSAKFVNG